MAVQGHSRSSKLWQSTVSMT